MLTRCITSLLQLLSQPANMDTLYRSNSIHIESIRGIHSYEGVLNGYFMALPAIIFVSSTVHPY